MQGIPSRAEGICQQHLFGQTHHKPLHAPAELGQIFPAAFQHLCHIPIANDGTGNQLGKQGHIGAEGEDVFLHLHLPAAHVNEIAHGLEDVEGDADGQGNVREGAAEKEFSVLKEAQHSQIQHHAQHQHPPGGALPALLPGGGQAAEIVQQDAHQHQQHIFWLSPSIKNQAGYQQQYIPTAPGA